MAGNNMNGELSIILFDLGGVLIKLPERLIPDDRDGAGRLFRPLFRIFQDRNGKTGPVGIQV
jgi:hypothetical protein